MNKGDVVLYPCNTHFRIAVVKNVLSSHLAKVVYLSEDSRYDKNAPRTFTTKYQIISQWNRGVLLVDPRQILAKDAEERQAILRLQEEILNK